MKVDDDYVNYYRVIQGLRVHEIYVLCLQYLSIEDYRWNHLLY